MAYIFITLNKLLSEEATSLRTISFCKISQELDREMIIISMDKIKPNLLYSYRDFEIVSVRNKSNSFLSKVFNYLFHPIKIKRVFNETLKDHKIEGVIFGGIPIHSVIMLRLFSKRNNIKLYYDCVEWYSPEQFLFGKFAINYVLLDFLNKYFINKQISVFSISSYLHNYFQSKGIRSTKIPIMLDMNEISFEKKIVPDKLCLVYAGSPGKKDYLKEIVEGLVRLDNDKLEKMELQLLGVTKEQLIRVCEVSEKTIEKLGDSVVARGRVSREEVLNQLQRADFTVLLRSPELRYAKAGFPTKVVESLATATPVICNITSDLGEYLIDGENSLIVETCSAEAFEIALRKALALTFEEKQTLCENARKTAELKFDYKMFKEQFNKFLCEKL